MHQKRSQQWGRTGRRDLLAFAVHSDQSRETNHARFHLCLNSAPLAPSAVQDNKEGREHRSVINMAKTQTYVQRSTSSSVCRNSSFYPALSFLCLHLCSSLHYKMVAAEIRPSSKRCFRHGVSPNTYFLF